MPRFEEEIRKALEERVFPGAALLVASGGKILYRNFFGSSTEKTIFDIASLTKPAATATITLLVKKERKFSLNGPASRYLNELKDGEKEKITIRHLLKHTSGLPSWRPYYKEISREHPDLVGKRESRRLYLEKIGAEPLEMPVSFQRIYSDLGFILLGILIEDFLGSPLDRIFSEKIAGPLEMNDTFYLSIGDPLPRPFQSFAATEDSPWRKKMIRGEVHDDNAYTLGGVAGHAGLFSTVDDLHRFLTAFENGYRGLPCGGQGRHPLFPQDLVMDFVGPKVKLKLGWDTPSQEGSQAGRYFSKNSIGHLGYTGCSFWADLDQDFHIILLTNRVHPSAQNEAIKKFRPMIHDLIYEELIQPGSKRPEA